MIKSGVYMIVEKINGCAYYGSSIDVFSRWKRHKWQLKNGIHHNIFMQRSWDKYGEHNFDFSFIEPVLDKSLLRKREQAWININTKLYPILSSILFNSVLEVGNGDLFNRAKPIISDERREELSKRMMGNKYALGKKHIHSEETKIKISNKLKGTRHSEESYLRASKKMKGKIPTIEARKNMSNAQIKRRNVNIDIDSISVSSNLKGRKFGSNHPLAKINEEIVLKIRDLYFKGSLVKEIADLFFLSTATIYRIIHFQTWKHIK